MLHSFRQVAPLAPGLCGTRRNVRYGNRHRRATVKDRHPLIGPLARRGTGPIMGIGPHFSEIVMGLGLIIIPGIEMASVCRPQFSVVIVKDIHAAAAAAIAFCPGPRQIPIGGANLPRQPKAAQRDDGHQGPMRFRHGRQPPVTATVYARSRTVARLGLGANPQSPRGAPRQGHSEAFGKALSV
jgi:hypothetical protein